MCVSQAIARLILRRLQPNLSKKNLRDHGNAGQTVKEQNPAGRWLIPEMSRGWAGPPCLAVPHSSAGMNKPNNRLDQMILWGLCMMVVLEMLR